MLHKNPLHALILIDELELHSSIFTCELDPPRGDALKAAHILNRVLDQSRGDESLWFAAATTPFRDLAITRRRESPAVSVVLGESLKVGSIGKLRLTAAF